ncbi:MAG: hypothetical protein HY533_05855 [Chloroflexi bacterium]|nr:hypothetical protein [Chloroflexota bacterium]
MIIPYFPDVKGVSILGGLGYATANEVRTARWEDNLVAGVANDIFVRNNLGEGASGNIVEPP